jgi:hypothetical protein
MAITWSQQLGDLLVLKRADPEFFDPRQVQVEDAVRGQNSLPMSHFVHGAWRGSSPIYDSQGKIRVVKTAHVSPMELLENPAEYVSAESEDGESRISLIPKNSLLITSTGVGSAGRTFFFTGDEPLVADGHITVLPIKGSVVEGAYVCAYLQSSAGRQQLIRLHRGSSRQIEIYPVDILTLQIPMLEESERARIGEDWLNAVNGLVAARNALRQTEQRIETSLRSRLGVDVDLGTIPV